MAHVACRARLFEVADAGRLLDGIDLLECGFVLSLLARRMRRVVALGLVPYVRRLGSFDERRKDAAEVVGRRGLRAADAFWNCGRSGVAVLGGGCAVRGPRWGLKF